MQDSLPRNDSTRKRGARTAGVKYHVLNNGNDGGVTLRRANCGQFGNLKVTGTKPRRKPRASKVQLSKKK
jgi:hypothetical protein